MGRPSRLALLVVPAGVLIVGAWALLSSLRPSRKTAARRQQAEAPPVSSEGEEERATPAQSDCRKAQEALLERINALQRQEGLPTIPFEPRAAFKLYYDRYYRSQTGCLGGRPQGSPAEFRFVGGGCQPLVFMNHVGFDAAHEKLFDQPTRPQWSREKAVAVGTTFLRILAGEERVKHLRLSLVKYEQVMEYPRYYLGEWVLCWTRVSADGHEFMADRAWLYLSEGVGILQFGLDWYSRYGGKPPRVLAKERAMKLALRYAKRTIDSEETGWFYGRALQGEPAAELKIVNPNHFLEPGERNAPDYIGDRDARLAWVVTFATVKKRLASDGDRAGANAAKRILSVWLDAETGGCLGGLY